MTGRGASRAATTPRGRELTPPRPSQAANRQTREPRFEGMEWMSGKAEDLPSDSAGPSLSCRRVPRQDRRFRTRSRDGRCM